MSGRPADIYTSALALLARREHSRLELQQKLLSRYPGQQPLVSEVLERLAREAYQSDERFVETYVRARQLKGIGGQRLRQELGLRGIEDHLIEQALAPLAGEGGLQQLLRVWQKKFAAPPADIREKHLQARFLLYRGFRPQEVESLFVYLKENATQH